MADKGPRAGFTRPVFFIFQIEDEEGTPIEFDKERLKILAATRDVQVTLDHLDKGDKTISYKKIETIT
jgi:hypothetical protein